MSRQTEVGIRNKERKKEKKEGKGLWELSQEEAC